MALHLQDRGVDRQSGTPDADATGPASPSHDLPADQLPPDRLTWRGRHAEHYKAAGRTLDTPMVLLAVVLGVALLIQWFVEVSPSTHRLIETISWFIWAAFVLEYLLLFWLAPHKRVMVRSHLLDLVLILLPVLRPLRVLRLVRVAASFGSALVTARRIFARRGLQWVLVMVLGVVVSSSALTMWLEQDEPTSSIDSFGTALWWAVVTCTTVGYGDAYPVSPGGKAVATVLMVVGIALLSLITASIASIFVEQDTAAENRELEHQLDELHKKVDVLMAQLCGPDDGCGC